MTTESCCGGAPFLSPPEAQSESWVADCLDYPQGKVLQVKTEWSRADRIGRFRARTTSFRMRYRIEPGLYTVGRPDADSPVMVTANYKLSFSSLVIGTLVEAGRASALKSHLDLDLQDLFASLPWISTWQGPGR